MYLQQRIISVGKPGRQWSTLHQNYPIFDASMQWIGLRENLQENPIFNGKIYGFL